MEIKVVILYYMQKFNYKESRMEKVIIDTDNIDVPKEENDLYISRKNLYDAYLKDNGFKVCIMVLAYNRVEKTKRCIESIIKYTKDIYYELVLIDNGSTDETAKFFKEVDYKYKRYIHITKNVGSVYGVQMAFKEFRGEYLVLLPNDVIVTTNWLNNLLKCYESDPKIGIVTPLSTNVSNLQQVNINFTSLEDLQNKAKAFNISNPLLWEERLRLINIVTVVKKEIIDLVGVFDVGFFHDFGEDDYCIRIRRAGYKIIVCGDTFVHHDHDLSKDKDPVKFELSLKKGRANYLSKYKNIDAWDDIVNHEKELIDLINYSPIVNQSINALGIDVRCGMPILELKNQLRRKGIFNVNTVAFTTDAKYYQDLLYTVDYVYCDRIEYIQEHIENNSYNYIILGQPINYYSQPISLLNKMLEMVKVGGKILFKLYNVNDLKQLFDCMGIDLGRNEQMPVIVRYEEIVSCLQIMKAKIIGQKEIVYNINSSLHDKTIEIISKVVNEEYVENVLNKLKVEQYLFCIER